METLLENKSRKTSTVAKRVTVYNSKYTALIEAVYHADNKPQGYKGTIESMLWSFFSKMSKKRNTWRRDTFRNLLLHLHSQGCYTILRKIEYVEVLANISAFGNKTIREIADWKKETYIAEDQLFSLIEFCFAKYPAPQFLASSFFGIQKKYMLWYVQLGSGKSVQQLSGMEIKLTARMAHEFRATPKGYGVYEALRRAQAIGYGANEQMAETIAWSGLTRVYGHEDFWDTVVLFFAKQKEVRLDLMNQLLDYLNYSIRENPNFSMRGRTIEALTRQSDAWHRAMYMQKNAEEYVEWKSSKIKLLNYETTNAGVAVLYTTVELLNSQELYEEGHDMCHCVGSYVDNCLNGTSSIFSLRKYIGNRYEKLATIEIDPETGEIVEAQAKYNTALSREAEKALEVWKDSTHLYEASYGYHNHEEYRPEGNGAVHVMESRALEPRITTTDSVSKFLYYVIWFLLWMIFRACMNL